LAFFEAIRDRPLKFFAHAFGFLGVRRTKQSRGETLFLIRLKCSEPHATRIKKTEFFCRLTDLTELAKLAQKHNIISIIDGTFASPLQKALNFGIDISIHSGTKYLAGHSDVLCGVTTTKTKEQYEKVWNRLRIFGGVLSPTDAFLLERGIKTLALRMDVHNRNALHIAQFLESHSKILKVFYPGLESHAQHDLAKQQMFGFGGMIAFEVKGGLENGKKFVESLKLITLAVSLGGVESLIEHPATMTHGGVSQSERLKAGITDGLLRLSVGIEDVNDLVKDIEQALTHIDVN